MLALGVTGFCAWAFPSLRKADRFVPPDQEVLAEAGGKDRPDVELPPAIAGMERPNEEKRA